MVALLSINARGCLMPSHIMYDEGDDYVIDIEEERPPSRRSRQQRPDYDEYEPAPRPRPPPSRRPPPQRRPRPLPPPSYIYNIPTKKANLALKAGLVMAIACAMVYMFYYFGSNKE